MLPILATAIIATAAVPAGAYTVYVSNERGNSITIIDSETMEAVEEIPVGQRPRGINLSPDGKRLYILASDDNHVQVMDTATRTITHVLPSGPDPELGVLHPSGNPLYVANEDDNLVTAIDVETHAIRAEIPVGIEPEGMGVSPDGKVVVNTSETTNMAHFIDTETHEIFANVLVDQRPRFAEFTKDGKLLYVSAEIGGTVSVIDPAAHEIVHKIEFAVPGVPAGGSAAGRRARHGGRLQGVCRSRPGEPRGARRRQDLGGSGVFPCRAKGLAACLHAGRKVSLHHQRHLERRLCDRRRRERGDQVDPGRAAALGGRGIAALSNREGTHEDRIDPAVGGARSRRCSRLGPGRRR